ncbi:MAG: peptidylprolyl isomerase, partial [Sedimentisphaerales bacterium]|nr:peptidylprolyl isomerase [Sedimentisphaerales bacterium]
MPMNMPGQSAGPAGRVKFSLRLDNSSGLWLNAGMKMKTALPALLGVIGSALLPQLARADISLIHMQTNHGDVFLELYPDDAPVTVENFLSYVERGFYDGLIFHRVIEDFMIQAGAFDPNLYTYLENDPNVTEPDWWMNPEFYHEPNDSIVNESDNGLLNERGTIAMARQTDVDSANSQFFINLVANTHLDPTSGNDGYAVLGRVIRGLEVVDAIAQMPTHEAADAFEDLPDDPVIIEKMVLIHTFGASSDAFEQTPFLGAADGIERTYQGQGRYTGRQFSQQFESETFLGIDALRWRQTADAAAEGAEGSEAAGIEAFSLLLARDDQENLWVLQYICQEGTGQEERRVDPNNPLDIVPFEQFTDENMLFRLISGDYDPENLADPNHRLILTGSEGTIVHQIVSFSGSLPGLDAYGDELVIVRQTEIHAATIGWSYYHDSVGLVLALQETSDDPADPNYFDPNDPGLTYRERSGWRLSWYGQSAPSFYPDSSDLSDVAFVRLAPGDIRIHRGQGSFAGSPYRLTTARENFLGIHCLVLSETAVAPWARPDRTLWLARDT